MSISTKHITKPARAVHAPHPAQPPPRRPAAAKAGSARAAAKGQTDPFARLVRGEPIAGRDAIFAIREGYDAAILKAASRFFDVPDSRIQQIAQVPASTAGRLERKQARIDSGATERIYRMGAVTRMAVEIFDGEAAAVDWMRQPNRALGNAAPLELMDTEVGAVSVRQVLNAIATGGAA